MSDYPPKWYSVQNITVYDFCEAIRCNDCMYYYRIISVSSTSSLAFPQVNEAVTQLQAVGPTLLEVRTVGFW